MPIGDIGGFYDADNVLVGSAVGFIAPADTDAPEDSVTVWDPAIYVAPWVAAGATEQGWQLNWNPTTNDVNIDEQPTPVDQQLETATLQFVANLAEDTVQSWMWALNATKTVTAPATGVFGKTTLTPQGTLQKYAVTLETQNQLEMPRRFYVPRMTAAANVGATFRRGGGGARLIPVTFTSICQLNEIVVTDITAAATA
jgi:hypothetical protein